jgi:hypothetical protein
MAAILFCEYYWVVLAIAGIEALEDREVPPAVSPPVDTNADISA